jgi:hypothetical protein
MAEAKAKKKTRRATGARRKKAATARPRAGAGVSRGAPAGEQSQAVGRAPPPARTRGVEVAAPLDVDAVLASVAVTRAALVQVQRKLNAISEAALDKLSKQEQEAWADELAATSNAIVKLDTVALQAINADFAGRVPELEQKTAELAAKLQKMKDVADIIASVGKVIAIVTEIAGLIK